MKLTECKPKVQQLLTKHRKIPDDIVQEFNKHFNNQPVLKATSLDKAINQLRCEMQRTLNQIGSEKTKRTQNREKKPCFDNELYDQRIMKSRERDWMKYHNSAQWKAHTRERNSFNTIVKYKNSLPPCSNTTM